MSSVNSTKSYILLFANFDSLSNMAIFLLIQRYFVQPNRCISDPDIHTHTHKKKIQKQWLVIFPFCSGYDRFFFLELEDVFRKFRFRARGSSFSTDFGVLHTSWFGFAFDRFRVILLRARGSPFSIELRAFRFRPRGSSLSASSSTWFLINQNASFSSLCF